MILLSSHELQERETVFKLPETVFWRFGSPSRDPARHVSRPVGHVIFDQAPKIPSGFESGQATLENVTFVSAGCLP